MKGHIKLFSLLGLILPVLVCARSFHNIPENLSIQKQRLQQYHDSGEYYHDISTVTQKALYYLKFRINQNKRLAKPKQLAIVFDIDETSLSNYDDMVYLNFGGTDHDKEALEADAHDPPIPYTRTLYSFAKNHGVAIFFITGRRERLRNMTEKNLSGDGYTQWAGLFMKPNDYTMKSVTPYKVSMRKRIVNMGYDIIFNMGDQESDLKGGYADMVFKLPDPFYLTA
jgi:predicted secreted acid phosphatase